MYSVEQWSYLNPTNTKHLTTDHVWLFLSVCKMIVGKETEINVGACVVAHARLLVETSASHIAVAWLLLLCFQSSFLLICSGRQQKMPKSLLPFFTADRRGKSSRFSWAQVQLLKPFGEVTTGGKMFFPSCLSFLLALLPFKQINKYWKGKFMFYLITRQFGSFHFSMTTLCPIFLFFIYYIEHYVNSSSFPE